MNREESVVLFNEVAELLQENGFTTPKEKGVQGKYNYRGGYMLFNCPHMCSSIRLFSIGVGRQALVTDIRTSFAKPLEWNRELAIDFINEIINTINNEDNNRSIENNTDRKSVV